MATSTPAIPTPAPTLAEVEGAICRSLAVAEQREPAAVRQQLEANAGQLPIDSLLAVEIVCELEEQFDVRLRENLLTAESLRSVATLAQRLCEVIAQDGGSA